MTPQLVLDDLLADLRHARRRGDLGRLALIAYCEVRRWARQFGETEVAEHSASMLTDQPHQSRESFLGQIDCLIFELEQTRSRRYGPWSEVVLSPADGVPGPGVVPGAASASCRA